MTEPYIAIPPSGKGRGVLALHAWWGLNDTFRQVCGRLAQEGYVALAPDLFSGQIAHTIAEAEQHLQSFDEAHEVPPILDPAVDALKDHPAVTGKGLGVIGFSMGAYWSLELALNQPNVFRAVTLFYGTNGGGGDFSQSKAAFLGHFAENDPYESPETVQKLEQNFKSAGRPVSFYTYPGTGHWFFEPDRPDAYNAAAASLAWDRTKAFLKKELM
jgi:carboxymethylenebutenolidase